MLPSLTNRRSYGPSWLPEYLRRMLHIAQMDTEYTAWQMFYLCVAPSRVYRGTTWHRQTKNQWARDDPAFTAILMVFMLIASLSYGIAFHSLNILRILWLVFWTIFVDFFLLGLVVATAGWLISNHYFRVDTAQSGSATEQKVEWAYAFDIHLNSFFPLFILLYVVQFFLLPILLMPNIFATLFANLLYGLAFAYYYRITFLGYSTLPFLKNTVVFLYPIPAIGVLLLLSVLFNINATRVVMNFYFMQY